MEKRFSLIVGVVFICIGIGYFIYPKIMLREYGITVGNIVNLKTAVPESMKKNNSKWAIIRIVVDSKEYFSDFIQVPMGTERGDVINVKYDKNNPSNMYLNNRNRTTIMFVIIGALIVLYSIFLEK